MIQHPGAAKKQIKKDAAAANQTSREEAAKAAMRSARGKDTWSKYEFAQMIAALDDKQRKALMNDLIDAVEKDNPEDSRKAVEEIAFIKTLFGKKLTLRDIAKMWGKSAPGVMKFMDLTNLMINRSLDDIGLPMSRAAFDTILHNPKLRERYKAALAKRHEERRKGTIVSGR